MRGNTIYLIDHNGLKIENFEDSKTESGSGTSILIVDYVVYVHAACR